MKSTGVINSINEDDDEPAPGFDIVHAGLLERLPGTLNGTEPSLMLVIVCDFPVIKCLNVCCEKGLSPWKTDILLEALIYPLYTKVSEISCQSTSILQGKFMDAVLYDQCTVFLTFLHHTLASLKHDPLSHLYHSSDMM